MLIRRLKDCRPIKAADNTTLRELLNPHRDQDFRGRYSLAWASVGPGESSQPHRLRTDEVYYVLAGRGEMHIDDDIAVIETGDAVEIPPGSKQWVRNIGTADFVFLCIVDPAWQAEDEL